MKRLMGTDRIFMSSMFMRQVANLERRQRETERLDMRVCLPGEGMLLGHVPAERGWLDGKLAVTNGSNEWLKNTTCVDREKVYTYAHEYDIQRLLVQRKELADRGQPSIAMDRSVALSMLCKSSNGSNVSRPMNWSAEEEPSREEEREGAAENEPGGST